MSINDWKDIEDKYRVALSHRTECLRLVNETNKATLTDEDGALHKAFLEHELLVADQEVAKFEELLGLSKDQLAAGKQTFSWVSRRNFIFLVPGIPATFIWPHLNG